MPRPLIKTEHFGKLCLVEPRPIRIARVPVNGDKLHESILLHPRYVSANIDHEIIELKGRVRGRTIEVLLDEPLVVGDKSYAVLSFKGTGADADKPLVLHPRDWYIKPAADELQFTYEFPEGLRKENWIEQKEDSRRSWGVLKRDFSLYEFKRRTFEKYGIPEISPVALNHVPENVKNKINRVNKVKTDVELSQLVRGINTNIRGYDFQGAFGNLFSYSDICNFFDYETVARLDAKLLNVEKELLKKRKTFFCTGNISDNRLIDGSFIDSENYGIESARTRQARKEGMSFIFETISDSLSYFCIYPSRIGRYLEILSKETSPEIAKFDPSSRNKTILEYVGLK